MCLPDSFLPNDLAEFKLGLHQSVLKRPGMHSHLLGDHRQRAGTGRQEPPDGALDSLTDIWVVDQREFLKMVLREAQQVLSV